MSIELLSDRLWATRREAWEQVIAEFRWETDNALARAMYAAVPRSEELYFISARPRRVGRLTWRAARPEPAALATDLAAEDVTLFPQALMWGVRYDEATGLLSFGFPRV